MKFKNFAVQALIVLLAIVQPRPARAECCGPVCGGAIGGMCGDCTTTSAYCGYGPCNIFGCNCDGGCRTGRCDQVGSAIDALEYFSRIAGADGAMSWSEFQGWAKGESRIDKSVNLRRAFDQLDGNRNRVIDPEEFDEDIYAPANAPNDARSVAETQPGGSQGISALRLNAAATSASAAYWTDERKRNARPMVPVPPRSLPPLTTPAPSAPPIFIPGSGDAQAQADGSIVSADVDQRPYWNGGKLFFTGDDGDHQCTAEFTVSANLVLTAGHCVWDRTNSKWYTNFHFQRAYDDGGGQSVSLQYVATPVAWTQGNYAYDYAVLNASTASSAGWLGLAVNLPYTSWTAIGYSSNYDCGNTMSQVTGTLGTNNSGIVQMVGNPMAPGASGGAWIGDLQGSQGGNYAIGVNSFYDTSEPANLYGPYFDSNVVSLFTCVAAQNCQ